MELIDLQSILPYDVKTVYASVQKTGRLVVSGSPPHLWIRG